MDLNRIELGFARSEIFALGELSAECEARGKEVCNSDFPRILNRQVRLVYQEIFGFIL